jgi:hypothetical protein
MPSPAGRFALGILKLVGRAVWTSTMLLIPLFGFWLASSLAAYRNASQGLALLGGLMLFPILPVGWELFYAWRKSKQPAHRPVLTGIDRLVLRTLIVNGLFLGGMMWFNSATAFRALAVRGDWMLEGHDGPIATEVRGVLLGLADRLDRRLNAEEEHYGQSDAAPEDVKPSEDRPDAKRTGGGSGGSAEATPETPDAPATPDAKPADKPSTGKPAAEWPLPRDPDPIVTAIPEAEQASIESVGKYLATRFSDKRALVKALHDYVVLRLTYDEATLEKLQRKDYANVPSQEAEAVFAARTGVCAGYARLMVALGKAVGVEITYVTGYIRDAERRVAVDGSEASLKSSLEGYSHAWNAVKLDERWLLLDATWDDPTGSSPKTAGDKPLVESTYLFTPPRLFALDHFPKDSAWQLLAEPLSMGDFVRQPMLSPRIGSLGLSLLEPNRSQVTVHGDVSIVLDNPRGARVSAVARDESDPSGKQIRCTVSPGAGTRTTITCELAEGEYEVKLFAAPKQERTYGTFLLDYMGSILVNSR